MVERKAVSDFYWLKTPPVPSVTPFKVRDISFGRIPQPWQTVGPASGSFKLCWQLFEACVEYNASSRRLVLENYPLLAVRKPIPMVAGDRRPLGCPLGHPFGDRLENRTSKKVSGKESCILLTSGSTWVQNFIGIHLTIKVLCKGNR